MCYEFRYYCSNSSLNNFDTRSDCEDKCGDSQDFCNLPVVAGPCSSRFLQYYYDRDSDTCQPFHYSGCSGNGNRFDTVVQCEQRCKKTQEPQQPHIYTGDPQQRGHEDDPAEEERRRHHEEERRRQEAERRRQDAERRRQDEEEQRRRYDEEERRRLAEEEDLRRPVTQEDICVLPVEQGPCRAAVKSYHYDASERRCAEFLYGGCGGNANRFESEEMCERQCGEFRGQG